MTINTPAYNASMSYPSYDPTALFAGDFPVRAQVLTVATGQNAAGTCLPRGTLLGRVTASGKYIVSVATAADGSQLPENLRVLAADTDTSAADVLTPLYRTGEFAYEEMTVDTSWTLAALQTATDVANGGLFIRSVGTIA